MNTSAIKQLVVIVFWLACLVTLPAVAQLPVTVTTDFVATLNQGQTMLKWADQLKEMRAQYKTLRQQYESITGSYGRGVMGLYESKKHRLLFLAHGRKWFYNKEMEFTARPKKTSNG